jgi:hypothetical protein
MKIYTTALIGLSSRDYNVSQVISELIDNSIANNANNIQVFLNTDELSIIDDGNGQDIHGTENALNLGKLTEDPTSQSVYGLGIKQLWGWLGDRITIATKKINEEKVHIITLSIGEIIKKYELLTDVQLDVKDKDAYPIGLQEYCGKDNHFWQLKITNLKKKMEINTGLMKALSRTFAGYIRRGLKISINGKLLKKIPPPTLVFEEKFEKSEWGLKGYWGIFELKTGGGSKVYGANTYHNDRMITTADREILSIGDTANGCKRTEHPSLYRLTCEVFFTSPSILDKNKVSNKNNWIKDVNYSAVQDYLFETVVRKYDVELEKIRATEEKAKQDILNEALAQTASGHLKDAFPELKRPHKEYKERKLGEGELIDTAIRTQGESIGEPSEPTIATGEGTKQTPQQPHIEKRLRQPLFIGGDSYYLKFINTIEPSEEDQRYSFDKNETEHIITIYINVNREDIKVLDSHQRTPLLVDFVAETFIKILSPALSSVDFVEEREKTLVQLKPQDWYKEIEEYIENIEKEDRKT